MSTTYSVLPQFNSYHCLGLRLDTEDPIIFINYYHHVVNKRPHLQHLLGLHLPALPLLLCGDFNTHSHSWSPPDVRASPWAHTLEDWLEDHELISLVPEGSITRRGTGKASLIDHIFVNLAFMERPLFPASCTVSFERSISSDHAALCLDLPLHTLPPPAPPPLGWIIEDQMEQEWKHDFATFPRPLITDVPSLSRASTDLMTLTEVTCNKFFARKKPPGPRSAAWWNKACSIAAAEVSRNHGPTRRHLSTVLRATIRQAKREWLEGLITDPSNSIWDLAKWRHGRRSPWIPAINGSSDPITMGASFRDRFFSFPKPPEPSLELPGPAAPRRPFYDITKREVELALSDTSNNSAPGPSGIGYKLVKWAFSAQPDFILDIFTSSLRLGHHPWTEAKVVIIPKPNKPDYSVPKAYRPVSLLECYGKVLEKIVANRFASDCNLHNILPHSQFGSRAYHSATDTCTLLRYKASTTINAGRIGGTLLFDISRFFDHLHPSFTSRVLRHLGIDEHTVTWVYDFMTRRRVTMSVNNTSTAPLEPELGTPQGSPLSPILSALVTSPILRLADLWDDTDLTLYVDDGNIFASSPTYQGTAEKLSNAARSVFQWLHQSGFSINSEKCEVMFFHPRRTNPASFGIPPPRITLALPDSSTISITPATHIRYLGVFFTPNLDWSTHVKIVSTRARSIIKGLGVLGNSIRGFNLMNWRRIFISVILPVLTYGCQVWFRDTAQITLIKTLQIAQNEACRKLAGTFHTTPTAMVESLVAIPPIRVRLRHLLRSSGRRLASLPPSHALRQLTLTRKSTLIPRHAPSLPILPPIAETPPFHPIPCFPDHPATPPWKHPRVTLNCKTKNTTPALEALKTLPEVAVFLASAPFHTPGVFLNVFAIYLSSRLHITDYCLASTPTDSLLLAATSSLRRVGIRPDQCEMVMFFTDAGLPTLGDPLLTKSVRSRAPLLKAFHNALSDILDTNPLLFITGHWFSRRWVNTRTREWLAPTVEAAFRASLSAPQNVLKPPSERLLEDWRAMWSPPRPGDPRRHFAPLGEPPDLTIHPFVTGVLTAQSRTYQSTAFQLITGHAFDAGYSLRFRRNAGDNTTCPHCGNLHTIDHALFECDHYWYQRATIIECDKNFLFPTLSGGKMLTKFLHQAQTLLRPLPDRNDPPDPTMA